MKVFVTGATGFLGSHLSMALVQEGHELTYICRDMVNNAPFWEVESHWVGRVNAVWGDLSSMDLIERVIAEYEIDAVIHLAAQTQVSTGAANPMGTFQSNIVGTLNVLEACRKQKVKRVIVASTDKVYGSSPIPYTESSPMIERTPYGASKVCADVLAQTYMKSHGLNVAITRCGNLYGPAHMNFSTLIPGTIKRIIEGDLPVVRFGGDATRDFLYIDDAVRAYLTLLTSKATGAFNFSGGEPKKIIDIVELIIEKMGIEIEPEIELGGEGEIQNQALDCSRAGILLGWGPDVPFDDGLQQTVDWYRNYFSKKPRIEVYPA